MSFLSRLSGVASSKKEDDSLKPDISRVLEGWSKERAVPEGASGRPENIRDWLRADLDRLTSTMPGAIKNSDDEETRVAFESAIHNLFGASGAYGGGALTRLSGSLQRLVGNSENLGEVAALINLHVQACVATVRAGGDESVSDAVCDALESQVEAKLTAKAAANW